MEQVTDRELMAAAYQLSTEIARLQKQLVAVQNEIEKRSIQFINSKREKESTDGKAKEA